MNDWAAAGGSNDVYVGQRLLYRIQLEEGDQAFGAVTGQAARSALFGILLLGTALYFLVGLVGSLFLHLNSGILLVLLLAAYAIVGLIPERQWVSQWELTLDGRAEAAGAAYATIAKTLRDRQIPVAVEPRRVRSSIGGDVRNYLVVRRGRYSVYVGVFPFGTGLFLTWTMWLDMSRLRIIGRYLAEVLATLVGRGSHFHQVIRSDQDRALREAVHNATREGVEAAVLGTDLSVEAIFGSLAVEDEEAMEGSAVPPRPLDAPAVTPAIAVPPRPALPPRAVRATPVAPVDAPVRPESRPTDGPVAPAAPAPPAATPAITPVAEEAQPVPAGPCPTCGEATYVGLAFCVSCGTALGR